MALLWSVAQEKEGGIDVSQNQTERFGLHLWEPGDDFLREEFNENFEALDDAVRVVCGSYTGNGAAGRVVTLGFTPTAVIVKRPENFEVYFSDSELMYVPAIAVIGVTGNTVNVVEGGFRVSGHGLVNAANRTYLYLAFR